MSTERDNSCRNDPNNIIKILIATDIHLGFDYNKKRGQELNDSFITFEEILEYGKDNEVDFVLLGGDLFHDTKPSQSAMLKCMELLRKYCLGSREIKIQFLSDPEVVFGHCAQKTVNYEDPNLNISMPVFSIHGNHDDPSFGTVGSMDLLSASGLVNYFGKWTDLTKIIISPLVIRKGQTTIALYGLSYINDQRLSRLFRDYKVDLLCPKDISDCFNILVLHQNRVAHKEYAYIPETKLPDIIDFVIWGHEHECRIKPEVVTDAKYRICQPGSSIATSLSEGEAKPKHVGILSISLNSFKLKPLKLKTVRPFVFENLILREQEIPRDYTQPLSVSVYNFVDNYIENVVIPKAATQVTGHPKQPLEPMIRLRIFYSSDDEVFDGIKLAQKYCDEVANPMDMIVFRKENISSKKSKSNGTSSIDELDDIAQLFQYNETNLDWSKTVQGGIKKHFSSEENKDKLTVLSVNGLNEALNRFIDRGDTDAFKELVSHQMKKTITHLENCNVHSTESMLKEIRMLRNKRMEKEQEEQVEIEQFFNNTSKSSSSNKNICNVSDSNEDEETDKVTAKKSSRGRGTVSKRGVRGGQGRTKSSLNVAVTSSSSKAKQGQTTLQYHRRELSKTREQANIIFLDDSD